MSKTILKWTCYKLSAILRKGSVKMAKFTNEDRCFCVTEFYRLNQSVARVQRSFRLHKGIFKINGAPTRNTILHWVRTAFLPKLNTKTRPRTAATETKIKTLSQIVRNNSTLSVRRIASITGSKKSTIHTILKDDLGFRAFKPQLGQHLNDGDP